MHLNAWLAFATATVLLGLLPGPAVTSIVGYALSSGRRTALASVLGIAVGALIATSLSHAAQLLRRPGALLWSKRAGGGVLIAAGVATAAAKT
jgi:threonine/homoserine/homoserine lactone efflux protein